MFDEHMPMFSATIFKSVKRSRYSKISLAMLLCCLDKVTFLLNLKLGSLFSPSATDMKIG